MERDEQLRKKGVTFHIQAAKKKGGTGTAISLLFLLGFWKLKVICVKIETSISRFPVCNDLCSLHQSEPYNCFGRRGRKEPKVLAALSKRLYVENKPYLVGGYSRHMSLGN